MSDNSITLPESVVREMILAGEEAIKTMRYRGASPNNTFQMETMVLMLQSGLDTVTIRMDLDSVMDLLNYPSISAEQFEAAQTWLFDAVNHIPARTANQTLLNLRAKLKE